MQSMPSKGDRTPDDLTARARIRNAAMQMFADQGYGGTSMRAVAAEVGVSIGLVQHHFGSKTGLRDACDEVAIGSMLADAQAASKEASPFLPPMSSEVDELVLRYLGRALIDGSPTAARLFDAGSDLAESWFRTHWAAQFGSGVEGAARVRAAAAMMAAMHLGPIALHVHLSRRLGVNVLNDEHVEEIPSSITDVYRAMASFFDTDNESQRGQGAGDA